MFQAFRKQRDLLAIHSLNGLGQSYSHLPDPCVQRGGNCRLRVVALTKSLKPRKRILAPPWWFAVCTANASVLAIAVDAFAVAAAPVSHRSCRRGRCLAVAFRTG
jgi:hypothetical protein